MERKGSSHGSQTLQESRSDENQSRSARMIRDQDQYMPIANIIRIMRRILPSQAKISDESKETIQECVSEYISFVTAEAKNRCHREQRKTVTADDLLWALTKLGFHDYVRPLSMFLSRYRESETDLGPARAAPFLKRTMEGASYVPAAATFHQYLAHQQDHQAAMATSHPCYDLYYKF